MDLPHSFKTLQSISFYSCLMIFYKKAYWWACSLFLVFYEYKQHTMTSCEWIHGENVPAYLQDVFWEVELLGPRIRVNWRLLSLHTPMRTTPNASFPSAHSQWHHTGNLTWHSESIYMESCSRYTGAALIPPGELVVKHCSTVIKFQHFLESVQTSQVRGTAPQKSWPHFRCQLQVWGFPGHTHFWLTGYRLGGFPWPVLTS